MFALISLMSSTLMNRIIIRCTVSPDESPQPEESQPPRMEFPMNTAHRSSEGPPEREYTSESPLEICCLIIPASARGGADVDVTVGTEVDVSIRADREEQCHRILESIFAGTHLKHRSQLDAISQLTLWGSVR